MRLWLPVIETGTGAEVWADRLAEKLGALGHNPILETAPHRFQYAPWLAPIRTPPDIDVIVANSWSAAAFAGRAPLVTVVHHVVHDPALASFKTSAQTFFHAGFVRPMERAALARSTAVVAVSNTTAAAITAFLGPAPVETVLNGVDTTYFTPADMVAPRDASDPIELLFVGKRSRRKGFDVVAGIVARLGSACRLTCIGSGDEAGLSRPPGRYPGRVSREALRDAYRRADFLLMPSRLEGFGYAAAEAMACGLPVVCASRGAVAEIVDPPGCGLACEGDDPNALADAILAVCHDPARHAAMRAEACRRARNRLDEDRWAHEMEALLERTAHDRARQTRSGLRRRF